MSTRYLPVSTHCPHVSKIHMSTSSSSLTCRRKMMYTRVDATGSTCQRHTLAPRVDADPRVDATCWIPVSMQIQRVDATRWLHLSTQHDGSTCQRRSTCRRHALAPRCQHRSTCRCNTLDLRVIIEDSRPARGRCPVVLIVWQLIAEEGLVFGAVSTNRRKQSSGRCLWTKAL